MGVNTSTSDDEGLLLFGCFFACGGGGIGNSHGHQTSIRWSVCSYYKYIFKLMPLYDLNNKSQRLRKEVACSLVLQKHLVLYLLPDDS